MSELHTLSREILLDCRSFCILGRVADLLVSLRSAMYQQRLFPSTSGPVTLQRLLCQFRGLARRGISGPSASLPCTGLPSVSRCSSQRPPPRLPRLCNLYQRPRAPCSSAYTASILPRTRHTWWVPVRR